MVAVPNFNDPEQTEAMDEMESELAQAMARATAELDESFVKADKVIETFSDIGAKCERNIEIVETQMQGITLQYQAYMEQAEGVISTQRRLAAMVKAGVDEYNKDTAPKTRRKRKPRAKDGEDNPK